jgi:hypothetical protein
MVAPWDQDCLGTNRSQNINNPTTTRQKADRGRWRICRKLNNMFMITTKLQLLENALASYQAAARELIAELKQQRDDVLAENAMLKRDIAKLDNFLANQDE